MGLNDLTPAFLELHRACLQQLAALADRAVRLTEETLVADDTACPLEEWNAKVNKRLAEVAPHHQEEKP